MSRASRSESVGSNVASSRSRAHGGTATRATSPTRANCEAAGRSWRSASGADSCRRVFDCVFVLPHGPVERRLHVCLRGTGPDDLPRAHTPKQEQSHAIDLEKLPPSPTLKKSWQRSWPPQRLRDVLDPFLEGRAEWPDFPEFQLAGLGLAHRQVEIWGGPKRWATEYGLTYHETNRPISGWSEERIRRELPAYLERHEGFPTATQFHADGQWQLQRAIARFGGPERWAREFGRELHWRQRARIDWTEERIADALLKLSADSGVMPTRRQMRASGLQGLARAVGQASGRAAWANRLGLRLPPRTMQPQGRWTEEAVERALREFLRGRTVYPMRREFKAAGLDHVYLAIERMAGGHERWAERHGLLRQHRGGRPPRRRSPDEHLG